MKKNTPVARLTVGSKVGFFHIRYGIEESSIKTPRFPSEEVRELFKCSDAKLQSFFDDVWKKEIRYSEDHEVVSIAPKGHRRWVTGVGYTTYYDVVLRDPRGETFTVQVDKWLHTWESFLNRMYLHTLPHDGTSPFVKDGVEHYEWVM